MTSNDVLELRDVPESVLVLGAGYIAVKFASILSALARGSRSPIAAHCRCVASTTTRAAGSFMRWSGKW
jgi:hypothetical protein